MKTSPAGKMCVIAAFLILSCSGLRAANVEILDQELNLVGQGHTVLRVWGSYYEMGYGHASVLGDCVVEAVDQTKGELEHNYSVMRNRIAASIWLPVESESELDGMVDCLNTTHPAAGIDKLDLKVLNTLGDWLYACRSHTCWGRYVSAPVKTLSTRRLDFSTAIPILNHHVVIAYDPNDGSPEWLNLAWPGIVTVAQGINEYGTLVSLHDYESFPADVSAGRISRLVAARHAVTYTLTDDISTHVDDVFSELQNYEIMTGGFVNYYAPMGFGGVINCSPTVSGPDFYRLRKPQDVWHHGEAMVTTNRDTDGRYTPDDEDIGVDIYYGDESPKTQESHWHLVDPVTSSHGLSRLSVAYRGRRDMTVWADGRLDGIGRTPRLEYEWSELFDTHIKYGGGTGEPNDPYLIYTAEHLNALGAEPDDYDQHFKLMADIDLSGFSYDRAVIAPDVNDATTGWGWNPFDGAHFAGVFDGNDHVISNLNIQGENYLGLFGRLDSGATISNLGLVALDVHGYEFVGGLVGENRGRIEGSYIGGTASGNYRVGGLMGSNRGSITGSYSTGTVSADRFVGGVAGLNGGNITNCYNAGSVTGEASGGLVGFNHIRTSKTDGLLGSISNSYSTGSVTGGGDSVGGLVGSSHQLGNIINCYSTGRVTGNGGFGGLVGSIYGNVGLNIIRCFWDIESSGQASSAGGIGLTTAEMQVATTFLEAGWDFNSVWTIWEGHDYPRLQWESGPEAGVVFVEVPGGTFAMGDHYGVGDEDERPVHPVRLDSFRMSKYETTNAQYVAFLNAAMRDGLIEVVDGVAYALAVADQNEPWCTLHSFHPEAQIHYSQGQFTLCIRADGADMSNHPVHRVSWYGAQAFCDYYGYRLPTEAEWEYAARGGYHDPYYMYPWGSNEIDPNLANYDRNNPLGLMDGPYNSPVGYYGAYGAYGLCDMSGNMWEWCQDGYGRNYYSDGLEQRRAGLSCGQARPTRPEANRKPVRIPGLCFCRLPGVAA